MTKSHKPSLPPSPPSLPSLPPARPPSLPPYPIHVHDEHEARLDVTLELAAVGLKEVGEDLGKEGGREGGRRLTVFGIE